MKIECLNGPLCEAENDARILTLTVDAAFASHEIRLGLLTPAGRRYLTPAITLTNGAGEYPLPACALDARGKLKAQIIAQNGAGQVAKSEVFAFPVARSIPCETAQTAASGLITLGSLDTAVNALAAAVAALAPVAGSGSYTDLTDRPVIPTVPETVSSFANDAGYLTAADVDGSMIANSENPVQSKVIQTALGNKQDTLIFDDTPTSGSSKPVTSAGIYSALAGKVGDYSTEPGDWDPLPTENSPKPVTSGGLYDALLAKQDVLQFDNSPTENSTKPVKSGGVYAAFITKLSKYDSGPSGWDTTPTANSTNPVTSGGIYAAIQGATGVTVDSSFVANSEYPVQSKVIKAALDGKQDVYSASSLVWDHTPRKNGTFPMPSGAIYNALYYKNNDTFTLQDVPITGHLTGAGKTVFLCVQVPKSLADITSITFDAFTGGLRTADGTDRYVESSTDATDWTQASGITLTATKKGDHAVQVKIEKSTAFSGAVNNNLVGLYCAPVTMKFHTS